MQIQVAIMPLIIFFSCCVTNAEVTFQLPRIGSGEQAQESQIRSSHMALANCSQAVAQSSFAFDQSLNNGSYSVNPGSHLDQQHLGRTYHYLGGVENPQLAIVDKDHIFIKDLRIFNWKYRGIQNSNIPISLFRFERPAGSTSNRRFSDYYFTLFKDHPSTLDRDRVQTISKDFASRTQIPLEQSVDFLNNEAISDPSRILTVKNSIALSLRKTMENFVTSMNDDENVQPRLSEVVRTNNMYEHDFKKFLNALCTCKDLPAFAGFESEAIKILLGSGTSSATVNNFSVLDSDSLLEGRTPIKRKINHSDLNCNFS